MASRRRSSTSERADWNSLTEKPCHDHGSLSQPVEGQEEFEAICCALDGARFYRLNKHGADHTDHWNRGEQVPHS